MLRDFIVNFMKFPILLVDFSLLSFIALPMRKIRFHFCKFNFDSNSLKKQGNIFPWERYKTKSMIRKVFGLNLGEFGFVYKISIPFLSSQAKLYLSQIFVEKNSTDSFATIVWSQRYLKIVYNDPLFILKKYISLFVLIKRAWNAQKYLKTSKMSNELD